MQCNNKVKLDLSLGEIYRCCKALVPVLVSQLRIISQYSSSTGGEFVIRDNGNPRFNIGCNLIAVLVTFRIHTDIIREPRAAVALVLNRYGCRFFLQIKLQLLKLLLPPS